MGKRRVKAGDGDSFTSGGSCKPASADTTTEYAVFSVRIKGVAYRERSSARTLGGSPELMEAGWTAMPSIILEKQHALGLDPVDVNILLQLARHWWYPDNPPHPSKASIAACLNVSSSTVQRHIAAMERSGFIKRVARFDRKSRGQQSNEYRFDGLIRESKPYAEEAIKERNAQRSERAARRQRRKPRLVYTNPSPDGGTQK